MSAEMRENPLEWRGLENLVHGRFFRSANAINAIPGAWWMPLVAMVESQGKDVVEGKVEVFESEMKAARKEAMEDIPGSVSPEAGPVV